ncbi:MAG: hypothetical protein AAF525_18865 [Pseudomonadota bacterium]
MTSARDRAQDRYGHEIFSDQRSGHLHVLAHQASDHELPEWGMETLEGALSDRLLLDSRWLHLHFHMARFEIDLGRWHAAFDRFRHHYIPAILRGCDVLTDAPALLWWLAMSAPLPVELPWGMVHGVALRAIHQSADPFIQLHQLLAFAGARDVNSLRVYVTRLSLEVTPTAQTLRAMANALLSLAEGAYQQAADRIARRLPELISLGGSHAQQSLFTELWRYCEEQATKQNVA